MLGAHSVRRTPKLPVRVNDSSLSKLSSRLHEVMLADREGVRRLIGAAQARLRDGAPADRLIERAIEQFEASSRRRSSRAASLPRPWRAGFPDLPVIARREEIAQAIRENQVVVISGETGSGKTTQIPQICLDLGRGVDGMIGHTQPRRIAARTVSARIAEELQCRSALRPDARGRSALRSDATTADNTADPDSTAAPSNRAVGYKVRFGDHTGPDTYIKVMTDGILLAETQADRWLSQYDTIIIDEAHERSLNIDFLLGYLRQLLPRRPELKIIVTSATIDPQRFAKHFTIDRPVPVIEVSGRTYPVEVRYRPLESEGEEWGRDRDSDQEQAILSAVDELASIDSGDILIFMSGEREIRQTAEALRKHHPSGTEILPLFARLSAAEQMRAFQPHQNRRILLATNVAETSLTVPGIRYVIDPGFARISRYSHRTKVQRLPIEPVSRASADQRKGRCGRVAEGVCIRLYSEEDYLARPQFTDPEIVRTNLASVILQMKALKLGRIEDFPFVDPPDPRMIRDGYETLHELGAITEEAELTPLGRDLAKLPIEPRIGRMILQGATEGCMAEVLVIASALSVQDPRERPMAAQQAADQAQAKFRDEQSDFVALLNLWEYYQEQSRHLSQSKMRKLCRDHFLSYTRMREWEDVHQQLKALVSEMGLHHATKVNRREKKGGRSEDGRRERRMQVAAAGGPPIEPESPDTVSVKIDYDAVHKALLAGLLANVGTRSPETFEYNAPRAGKYSIFPGSGLFKKGPRWVVAAEVVQTTRLYARTVAKIQPEWIEPLALHLVKRSHSDPHWSRDSGQVLAFEKVTLWGLEIVARRRVNYGPVDPAKAREIFIHNALVEAETRLTGKFLEHNQKLLAEARSLEARTRRHDLVADNRTIYEFYDARLPADVYSTATLEKWRKEAERTNPRILFMSREDVFKGDVDVSPHQYPDAMPAAGTRLNITYECDPGGPTDGVTLVVPIEALAQLDDNKPEWLVPGLLRDKILAIFRTLPKQFRKGLDPAPALAEQCAKELKFGEGSLFDALAAKVQEHRKFKIPREAWQPRAIPDHLRMNISVVDHKGKQLGQSRDLAELKKRYEQRSRGSFAQLAKSTFDRDNITDWDFDPLPERADLSRSGLKVSAFPAIVDKASSVALRLLDTAEAAQVATHAGVRRLFVLQSKDELEYQIRICSHLQQMALHYAPLGKIDDLKRDLRDLIAERAFMEGEAVRTKAAFDQRLVAGARPLNQVAREVTALAAQVLASHHAISLRLSDRIPPAWMGSVADIRHQLGLLMPPGFLRTVPWARLVHYPRYLNAIQVRLQRLQNAGVPRDQRSMQELAVHWRRYIDRANGTALTGELETYRWMLEEFRVSLFAQELGTAQPVSAKRLEEQWGKVIA